jgi:hypothetical protein
MAASGGVFANRLPLGLRQFRAATGGRRSAESSVFRMMDTILSERSRSVAQDHARPEELRA